MNSLENFTDTMCELLIAESRLKYLQDRRSELFAQCFPITSHIKEVVTDGGGYPQDKMARYISALHDEKMETGRSLADEIEYQTSLIQRLNQTIKSMETSLLRMQGIEYKLYYNIVVEGVTPTEAVQAMAKATSRDEQTIWKYYYRNIKKDIEKIRKYRKKK